MNINKNIAISDTGFIFNPATGDSFTSNKVGMFIIDLLKQNKTNDEVVNATMEQFNIDKASAEKDLSDFIMMLKSYQLIIDQND